MAARKSRATWRRFWRRRRAWLKRAGAAVGPGLARAGALLALAVALLPPFAVAFFAVVPVPFTPLMVLRMIEGQGLVRVPVPLDDISPLLIDAVIASEDARFCLHRGFDWKAIRAASAANAKAANLRGASTISMQTAKNVFLWPERSWLRKGFEAYTTFFLEHLWSKRRILETYLNVIEWGPGIYGAQAAARYHFATTAGQLTREQAARLAVLLPNPHAYAPDDAYVTGRANTIMRRMGEVRNQGLDKCVRGKSASG